MSYTIYPDKRINDKIHSDIQIICEEILKIIEPISIISIILTGSFGRGEGSVLIQKDKIFPLKDYDIILITNKRITPLEIKKIADNAYERLGYNNPKSPTCAGISDFVISILPMTLDNLIYLRDVKAFDIKTGSKILYGKDIRNDIKLTLIDLPLSSGARFLLQKIIGLIALFPSKHMDRPPSGLEKLYLNYECGKTYIEMGTALALISRMYIPTYSGRSEIISKDFKSHFLELSEETPLLDDKIKLFTRLKLLPDNKTYDDIDTTKLWFETRRDLGLVLKYYMGQYLTIKGENWIEFSHDCYIKMKKKDLCDMIGYYIKKKIKTDNYGIVKIINILYQKYFSLNYMLRLYKKEKIFLARAIGEFPVYRVFTASILLLFSLNDDGTLNESLFNVFVEDLGKIYPVKIKGSTDKEKWDDAMTCLLRAHDINGEVAYRI